MELVAGGIIVKKVVGHEWFHIYNS
jgi:hypothetical protein